MTGDLGMGANIAIESAIYLANILYREFGSRPTRRISTPDLNALFAEYQAGRHERASKYVALSGNVTRAHAYQTYFGRFFSGYVARYMAPMHKKGLAKSLALAPKLSYVPTRTIDEGAEGWQLALETRDEPRAWLIYVVLTSIVGVIAAYCVRTGLSVRV
jgi:FAD dependent monooxygenase